MVQGEAARIRGEQDEGRARHLGRIDADAPGQPAHERGLARPRARRRGARPRRPRTGRPSAAATSSVSAADRVIRAVIATASDRSTAGRAAIRSLAVSDSSPRRPAASSPAAPWTYTAPVAAVHASVPAGEQGAHDARQHVAGAGGRHAGVAGRVDRDAAVGVRDQRALALQDDDRARRGRRAARGLQPAALDLGRRSSRAAAPSRPDAA